MGSPRRFPEPGRRGRGQLSVKRSLCDAVLQQVVERVQAAGYDDSVSKDLKSHFSMLPARYALNIDPARYEDVLLHMGLLREARESEAYVQSNPYEPFPLPSIHVRRVSIAPRDKDEDEDDDDSVGGGVQPGGGGGRRRPVESRLPKPAFGSNSNLASLLSTSPLARMYSRTPPQRSTPPGGGRGPPAAGRPPRPRQASGSFTGLLEMEEYDSCDSMSTSGQSEQGREAPMSGWEITVATSDRPGLLRILTDAITNSELELNIKEAHVFSSSDGMALEVFVVEGWSGEADDLQQEILLAVSHKLSESEADPMEVSEEVKLEDLRQAVEAIAYEDWAVDYNDLEIGERLGGGSSGRLYRGVYRGQDVAVKVIVLANVRAGEEGCNVSGSLRAAPATELLQMFKQEVAIMRIVRHKNLVQFIGACSCWPKLCIVTELMAGGSVRDVIQARGSGLEPATAVKVFRDAARGIDFLHRRGVVHRDLKAANLLIDEHDVVKVCDFGVARMKPVETAEENRDTAVEMTAETGTYRWMAPEVLEHRPYNHKADVYSFGIMMWEILTGQIPYTGLTPLQAAIGVVQRGLRPEMPADTPPKLSALAERCWAQHPDDRPEFSEILSILEESMRPPAAWKRSFFTSPRKKPVAGV